MRIEIKAKGILRSVNELQKPGNLEIKINR